MANEDDVYYEETEKYCKIYDEDDFFTVAVQLILAVIALASLWVKRMQEVPRRLFWTWFMDVFKQGMGACYAHVLNMVIAAVLAVNMRGDVELKDQCAWYGISFLIDTTLGLFLAIVCLRILDFWAKEWDWAHLKHSGVYVGPDGWKHWISQLMAWMGILTIVKIIMYLFMWVFSSGLAKLGQFLFEPLQGNLRLELLFVMILFPGFMNIIYFWIADSYLQAQGEHEGAHEPSESFKADSKKESLLEQEKSDKSDFELRIQKPPAPIV
uniref:Uncharacterized protein n=1 Tax=Entomoneis paludosa TaxID=265537 RepID=A0A7S2YKT1_9STRA|mmetsp:Transcript_36882/g.76711  ORF Transcript_36882/g.76711 Transcript_36882/m.76711 type:complete len:268 (+) Transcript_36882:280-1083(+)|eukprot:CAMPEP_0172458720 /NCGR_PEP_ID=MMETSP1065-20121228/28948_1 /TAXON_ID=265537 /ORGANISM="Amphiprora paludosa, Strain CCMP125" /LENGTH=267 /DNA_ID=CAMNT_0013213113 /DNA_START=264 /DNA_END=1067 /DNA_ORIENTATION=+